MRRFRFNIASLLVVVLVLGFGFAALRESNDLWDSGLFTLTLGASCWSRSSLPSTAVKPGGHSGSASPCSAQATWRSL